MKAEPVQDAEKLPGESLYDQVGDKVGEIKDVYGQGDGGDAAWVTVEVSTGLTTKRLAFVPLARIKREDDELRVPYRGQHVVDAPEVDADDEVSSEDERALRDHYGIDRADQELRTDNEDSYAARVPNDDGPPTKQS